MTKFSDLTVIVPARNEESSIGIVLAKLREQYPYAQLIVVDNNSTDSTVEEVLASENSRVQLIRCLQPGKGAAMREGLKHATGGIVLFHDADLEYSIEDSQETVHKAYRHPTAMIVGQRTVGMGAVPWSSLVANTLIRVLLEAIYGKPARHLDVLSGTRAASLDVWNQLQLHADGFEVETEITRNCLALGIPIFQTMVRYIPRSVADGKKIRTSDIWKLLFQAWKVPVL